MNYIKKGFIIIAIMFVVYIAYDVVSVFGTDSKKRSVNDSETTTTELEDVESEGAKDNNDSGIESDSKFDVEDEFESESEYEICSEAEENVEVMQAGAEYAEAIPSHKEIDMEIVYQNPELPTGCESVALTILLKYYGFTDLEKTTIASEYLIYDDNYVIGYCGNPFSYNGAGIYPPGLVKTANNFFDENQSTLNAKDITGSTPQTIYKYVANGTPVIIWNTIHLYSNNPSGSYTTYKGTTYHWDYNEHCVVMSGYDFNRNVVIIHDPVDGIVERDADEFWERYENLGSMAMIVR